MLEGIRQNNRQGHKNQRYTEEKSIRLPVTAAGRISLGRRYTGEQLTPEMRGVSYRKLGGLTNVWLAGYCGLPGL